MSRSLRWMDEEEGEAEEDADWDLDEGAFSGRSAGSGSPGFFSIGETSDGVLPNIHSELLPSKTKLGKDGKPWQEM
ncbi:hypothetical protein JCM10450v2_003786 [Rhodotorula kratochvilovae]